MANEKNLRTPTTEEARQIGRLGGLASAESRRKKKNMKEAIEMLLQLDVKNTNVKKQMLELGIPEEDATNEMALVITTFNKAIKGDLKATEFLRDTSGQKPVEKQELNTNVTGGTIEISLDYGKEEDYNKFNE